jgi:hypothetical protein
MPLKWNLLMIGTSIYVDQTTTHQSYLQLPLMMNSKCLGSQYAPSIEECFISSLQT